MNWIKLALLSSVTACSSGAVAPKTTAATVASPHASLASYRTFSFGLSDQPKPGYEVTPRSLEVQRRLRSVVEEELRQRGYAESDATGGLVVKLAAGTGPAPTLGAERAVPSKYARGYIGVHIYDSQSGAEVWQGSAFAEIDPQLVDDALLRMGVMHMLADFPARETASLATTP